MEIGVVVVRVEKMKRLAALFASLSFCKLTCARVSCLLSF
jgi:hypothetical protein